MRFIYPARFQPDRTGEIIVSFRDLPECLTSGSNRTEAQAAAADALEEAIAGRIDDGEEIPTPSPRCADEHLIAVPADMAAKAALVLAFRKRMTEGEKAGIVNVQSFVDRMKTQCPPRGTPFCHPRGF